MFIAWHKGDWYEVEFPELARAEGFEVLEVEFMPMKSRPEWLDEEYCATHVAGEVERGIESIQWYLRAHDG